jgi:hypothetical protein
MVLRCRSALAAQRKQCYKDGGQAEYDCRHHHASNATSVQLYLGVLVGVIACPAPLSPATAPLSLRWK